MGKDLEKEFILTGIIDTIERSKIRALKPEELISRVPMLWREERYNDIIGRLAEIELNSDQLKRFTKEILALAENGDELQSREKAGVDRMILRLVRILPPEFACEIAEPQLSHKRKVRREIAYKALRKTGVDKSTAQKLITRFKETGDEFLLELIARSPDVVASSDPEFLLRSISEHYWRARIMEGLILHDREKAIKLSSAHPKEFIHAAGRIGDTKALPVIQKIYDENSADLEIVSLYAWVLGKLSAIEQLEKLSKIIRNELNNKS